MVSGKVGFGTKQIRERVRKRFGRNYLHREFMAEIPKLFRSFSSTEARLRGRRRQKLSRKIEFLFGSNFVQVEKGLSLF